VTEAEWLVAIDPLPMLEFLQGYWSGRKAQLLACAWCHRIRHLFPDEVCQTGLEMAELHAEGAVSESELRKGRDAVETAWRADADGRRSWRNGQATPSQSGLVYEAVTCAMFYQAIYVKIESHLGCLSVCAASAVAWGTHGSSTPGERAERGKQAMLLRDIFGNPFRPVALDPRWLTSSVVDLARSIYEADPRQAGGYMTGLPILADALMDAGCDSEELLAHCRSDGPHVRGCWVVDLILGKS
jgi:hypothetical protein